MKKRSGFTLIELLVVVIILGILAAIAIPRFMIATEQSRVAEATRVLGAIREAEENYQQTYNTYSTNLTALGANVSGASVVDAVNINTRYWRIYVSSAAAATFEATANKTTAPNAGLLINLNQNGNWSGNHPNVPGSAA